MRWAFFILLIVMASVRASVVDVPSASLPAAKYARWAHLHWVWKHNAYSNQGNVTELVNDYLSRGVKVGAVNIDSTWATEFNNFQVNLEKFPAFGDMVSEIHGKGVKITMWVTSMVKTENPDFNMAVENKFLVRNHKGEVTPIKWWHGSGGLLDYSNPDAVKWWHEKMDQVLKLSNGDGVDGWKCDGTDPYIDEYMLAGGALGYQDKPYVKHEYSDYYYRDFLAYTRERRGAEDGLVMGRPVDCQLDRSSTVCWGYAPLDTMVSGWVGDDDSTWNGLRGAMRKVIYSAWDGYANFGFDIGGYREQNPPSSTAKELFIRWAQLGAFLPLMENGGGGEHRPWMYDEETLEIYRVFANTHSSLSYYLQTVGSAALEQGISTITPQEARKSIVPHSPRNYPEPTDFSYLLGPDIFVHPILHESEADQLSKGTIKDMLVRVKFPACSGGQDSSSCVWLDFWRPTDSRSSHKGGDTSEVLVRGLKDFPVFVRQGALFPVALDDQRHPGEEIVAFSWFMPVATEAASVAAFDLREEKGTGLSARATFTSPKVARLTLTAHAGRYAARIVGVEPSQVSLDVSATTTGCTVDPALSAASGGVTVVCEDVSRGAIVEFALL